MSDVKEGTLGALEAGRAPRVAVVGCGRWGQNLVRTMANLGALAAVVDADPARAAALAAEHGVAARSLEDVLADPSIDGVVVAAPAVEHATLALAVIDAGKDVFVEKPLALAVADAELVVERARAAGVVVMVGHLLQYHPAFAELRRLVDLGTLGELRYLYSHRLNLGQFRQEESSLWSFAPHDLSMLLSLAGEEPSEVSAVGSTFLNAGVADVTTTHLAFPSGPHAHVFVSWLHPFKEQRLVVVGAEAMVVFDDTQPWDSKLVMYEHGVLWDDAGVPSPLRATGKPIELTADEPLRLECEHFLACMRTRATPRTDGAEGLRVLRVLAAAQASIDADPASAIGPAPASPNATVAVPAASGLVDDSRNPGVRVHGSAFVDEGARVGVGTVVWHFSHVLGGSVIGRDCSLGQNVVVGPDVTVGDRCRIQNNVSVYRGVTLGAGVFCGPSSVFTNVLNPRAEISRKDEFADTHVGDGATIGANATIVCGNDVGELAFVAAGAVVTRDVAPHALVVGCPARQVGWVSHDGERLGDDLVCPRPGRRYAEVDGRLVELVAGEPPS